MNTAAGTVHATHTANPDKALCGVRISADPARRAARHVHEVTCDTCTLRLVRQTQADGFDVTALTAQHRWPFACGPRPPDAAESQARADVRPTRVYIAAPLNAPDAATRDANFDAYLKLCACVTRDGFTVLSWAGHTLAHMRNHAPLPEAEYIARSAELIAVADAVWLTKPLLQTTSIGLIAEYGIARLRFPLRALPEAFPRIQGVQLIADSQVAHFELPVWFPPWRTVREVLDWAADAYAKRARGEPWRPDDVGHLPALTADEVQHLLLHGNRIPAIKTLRERTGLGLFEAKYVVTQHPAFVDWQRANPGVVPDRLR